MRKTIIVCIDPGKKTGVATLEKYENSTDPCLTYTGEYDFEEFQDTFADFISRNDGIDEFDIEVVIEDFKITTATGKLTDAPWSLKHIGFVEYMCRTHGVPLTLQLPSCKDFTPNARLKKLELWHKGGDGHALDALRHAVYYLVMKHKWRPEKLLVSDYS